MPEYNLQEGQAFQRSILERVRVMERTLDREVLAYYQADPVDSFQDAQENFRGLHRYLKGAYKTLDGILDDLERRPEFRS
jgi:hypothetical protein